MKLKLVFFPLLLINFYTLAQLPQKFNYQAIVRNNTGSIVANQQVGIRFSIRHDSTEGVIQYQETHSVSTNAVGLINLQVGDGTVISGSMSAVTWHTGSKFLEIEIDMTESGSFVKLATLELVAVPYALHADQTNNFSGLLAGEVHGSQQATAISDDVVTTAKIADNAVTTLKVDDAAISTSKLSNDAVTTSKLADNAVTELKLADSVVTTDKLADSVVISSKIAAGQVVRSINSLNDSVVIAGSGGTTIDITGDTIIIGSTTGTLTGVNVGVGLTGGGTSGNVSVAAQFGGNGTANSISRTDHTHVGQTWSTNSGYMLRLYDYATDATPLSINSYATGFSNAGISSQIFSSTGQSIGVFGNTVSSDAYAAGIFGQAYSNGAAKGVWGLANGANTFGIYGQAAGANSWAGYFEGRVHVNGTLSKAAGSFKIDHPLDPANKYLSHSFVESPDMMNVYNGNIVLDANGEATVVLPDWFEALNKDFRYQLTSIGKPSPGIYISEEVSENRFKVAGGTPGGKISWMVTGIRHDRYAVQNPIQVEEQKPSEERGSYLYPEGYGQSARKSSAKARVIDPPKEDNQRKKKNRE